MRNYKNLLVTGGAGFIGSTFVAQCVARGCKVVVLDKLTYAGRRENLTWIPSGWELVVGDICDRALTERLLREHNIDALINFAAESHVDNSISGPKAFIDTNIGGTFALLEAARGYAKEKAGFRYVQISTDEVYGELGDTGKFSETTPYAPNSPYSASKAAADHLVRAWHETYGLDTITTHCTNNYGPRQHPEKLIPRMISCALAGEKLPVYGKGLNVRDWIHVEDHANGIWLALTKGKAGQPYDFGGNAEEKNIDLVRKICRILDRKRPIPSPVGGGLGWGLACSNGNNNDEQRKYAPLPASPLRVEGRKYEDQISFVTDRLGHDLRYAMDDTKAQKELGFTRAYTLEQGLEMTVEWYLANG